jgi:lipopolysaccharide/colanic/teichoic acid biosynthesis glycosyltransferase
MDVTCVILSLPLVLPLTLAIVVVIKLVSKGPVLFIQERVGQGRRSFRCLKFRTMKTGAVGQTHCDHTAALMNSSKPWAKMDGIDPRLIPFGSLLRATGMDELPQLLNVVRGEMSLVGPRPCTTYELERYVPWQMERFDALPGLTGLWQVSGKNKTTFAEMICMDINYAKTISLWLDIKIILKTIPALLDQFADTIVLKKLMSSRNYKPQRNMKEIGNERFRKVRDHRLRTLGTKSSPQLQEPGSMHSEDGLRRAAASTEAHQKHLSRDPRTP